MKWRQIEQETYEEFLRLRESFIAVHQQDLFDYAVSVAERIGLDGFKVWLKILN